MTTSGVRPIVESMGRFLGTGGQNWTLVFFTDRRRIHVVSADELAAMDLARTGEVSPGSVPRPPEACSQISLLMNSRCNFKCSYCYAAQSRTDEELSAERIRPLLERWMSDPALGSAAELEISFSGGGNRCFRCLKSKKP